VAVSGVGRSGVRSRFVVGWAWGVSLSLSVGCGSMRNQTISLSNDDAGRIVVAAVGDRIEVTLQTIGPGQYGNPTMSSRAVLFLDESSVGPPIPAGPTQLYRFEAIASGQADITVPHSGDPPEGPGVPAFSISVRVQ
jgi:hypothetical protein